MRYYSENGFYIKIKNNLDEEITLEELVDQYFGNAEGYFKLEDSNSKNNPDFTTITTTEEQHQEESQEEKEKNNFSKGGSAEEYLQKAQNPELSQQNPENDIKIAINSEKEPKKLFDSEKTNKIIYSDNDNSDSNTPSHFSLDYLDQDQRKSIERHLNSGKVLKCHHKNCLNVEFSTLYDYNMHCHNSHPKQPLHPELSLIELLNLEPRGNPWESVDDDYENQVSLKEFDN
ncbi:MAG: hypothetical protein ACM3VV_03585 [Deltaproteobacteria bacterium]